MKLPNINFEMKEEKKIEYDDDDFFYDDPHDSKGNAIVNND